MSKFYGVLVGVDYYPDAGSECPVPDLTCAVNDVDRAYELLAVSPLDTELILLANTDARVATIESTIGKICNSVSDGDTVFFMFAGHGFGYSENGRTLGLCLTSESLFEKGERPLLKPTLVLSEAPLKVLGHISPCSSRGTLLRSKIATALRVVAVWGICGVRSARRTPFTG